MIVRAAWFVLAFAWFSPGISQSDSLYRFAPELCDSLMEIQRCDGDLEEYARLFKELRNSIKSNGNSKLYEDAFHFLRWDKLERDSIFARKQYYYYAYATRVTFGAVEKSLPIYLKAHSFGGDLEGVNDFWYVENVLGLIYNIKGDHELSEYYYSITLSGIEKLLSDSPASKKSKFKNQLIRVKNNLGQLYYWMGQYERARKMLEESLKQAQLDRNYFGISSASISLARNYLEMNLNDHAKNNLLIHKANISNLRVARQSEQILNNYYITGLFHQKKQEFDKAIDAYRAYLNQSNTESQFHNTRSIAKNYKNLAHCYLQLNQIDSSEHYVKRGLDKLGVSKSEILKNNSLLQPENTIAELLDIQSKIFNYKSLKENKTQYLDSALISIERALGVYDLLRNEYLLENSKLISIKDNRKLVNEAIAILWQLKGNKESEKSVNSKVESFFLRSKNLALDHLRHERKTILSMPPLRMNQVKSLQNEIFGLTTQKNQVDKDSIHSIELNIVTKRNQLKEIISTSIPQRKRNDLFYLDYLIGDEHIYGLSKAGSKTSFKNLGTKKNILDAVYKSIDGIRNKISHDTFYQNQNYLYQKLLAPFSPLPKNLTVYPDGPLNEISFNALIIDSSSRTFVVEKHAIGIGSSSYESNDPPDLGSKIVAITPEYPKVAIDFPTRQNQLYHLPYVNDELTSIENIWEVQITRLKNISKRDLIENIADIDIMHYAGHTITNNDVGFLAIGTDTTNWISANEISNFPNHVPRIVLSACETGNGQYAVGEGVKSLARSFLQTGTQSILFSLWPINDQSTARLMANFYKSLLEKKHFVSSIRDAQITYISKASKINKHPYYWASFQATDLAFNKTNNSNPQRFILLSILFLFIIFSIYKIATK